MVHAWLLLLTLVLQTGSVDAQALQRMVASERAFAAATAQLGVRDGFLTFFGPDAVQIVPGASGASAGVTPALDALAARPLPPLPLTSTLMWEPFTGHVSTDGTLGWLTGGYVVLGTDESRTVIARGAYFSVWKRQPDGTWRVWLDEGIDLPAVWRHPGPFRVAPEPDAGGPGDTGETVAEAEREIATDPDAWRGRLAEHVRVHRQGVMPVEGRRAVSDWSEAAWQTVRYTVVRSEIAASGDLAIVIGGYDATTPAGAEHGTWVRVWKQSVSGTWRIVFETSKAA